MKTHLPAMSLVACLVFSVSSGIAAAAESAQYRGRTFDEWIKTIKKEEYQYRREVRDALGPDGPYAKKAVPILIELFKESGEIARGSIRIVLSEYGTPIVPSLIEAMKSPNALIREGATSTIASIRPSPIDAIPALTVAMKDGESNVRQAAAASLGTMRRAADKVIPSLIAGLENPDPKTRAASAGALGKLGTRTVPGVGALAKALKDPDHNVRSQAIDALKWLGPSAASAAPALVQAFSEKSNSSLRSDIAFTLTQIGPASKDAVPLLISVLDDEDTDLQARAVEALGAIGPAAAEAVPRLLTIAKMKLSKDDNTGRPGMAIHALGQIGPAAKAAVPFLIEELRERLRDREHPSDVSGPASALGGIGPEARMALPLLISIVRDRKSDRTSWDRKIAVEAITKIDPVFAAKEQIEFAYLDIRLGKIPKVVLRPRPKVTEEKAKHIKDLIAKLAEIDRPDFGLSPSLNGSAFTPLPGHEKMHSGLITNHNLGTNKAFRELVEAGPTALPFLLDALADEKPTRLKIQRDSAFGFFGVGGEMPNGNPFNTKETKALAIPDDDSEHDFNPIESYTIKVGDVCFVAIGQILGRPYQAVSYIPSGFVSINGASTSPRTREKLRTAWSGNDPAKVLLDSLLIDYASEGIFNGESLDGWDEGNNFQIAAAMRLLYYFPDEMAPIIADRLKSLDVKKVSEEEWMKQTVKNGVRSDEFIKAVSWCKAAPIQEALKDIAKRTNDPEIKKIIAGEKK